MARLPSISRQLTLATADIAPENVAKELAAFARMSLREAISEGEASDIYDIYVNGQYGASEDTVVPPGPILYDFQWWPEIVTFALATLVERSPERSGRYKQSWFAMVDNVPVVNFERIPIWSEVVLTNNQPYSRKIEVGHMRMSVPPGVVEDSKKIVMRRFGNMINAKATMINLPNGYILKGVFRKGYRPGARTKLRKDTQAGARMTYPALTLSMRE